MSDLQERLEKAIVETLKDPDGAGSDLERTGNVVGPWMYVEGNLDVRHLASHVIEVLGLDDYEYAVELTVQGMVKPINRWTTKENAEYLRKSRGTGRTREEDPVFGPWSSRIVKRRKAGAIEDA